jgi:hypothetical protein
MERPTLDVTPVSARISIRSALARPVSEGLRATLVVALCFAVYSANGRVIPAAAPWRPGNAQFLLELRDGGPAKELAPAGARAPAGQHRP